MEAKNVTVVARMRAKKGVEERLREELLALVKPSRADQGCMSYDLHQAIDTPDLFIFYENWQSKGLLDKHLATPHLQAFIAKAKDLLAEPIEITLVERIS